MSRNRHFATTLGPTGETTVKNKVLFERSEVSLCLGCEPSWVKKMRQARPFWLELRSQSS